MKLGTDTVLRTYFKLRQKRIEEVIDNSSRYQNTLLKRIVSDNRDTEFGRENNFDQIKSYEDYSQAVGISDYETHWPYIRKMMEGAEKVLCSDRVDWFAKSSGTSTGRSKYIPVSHNYLVNGHLKCAWDAASFIYNEDPKARLFADKTLIMGGTVSDLPSGKKTGDISGIIIKHFPKVGKRFYTPDFDTALMEDWDKKIKAMARITSREQLTLVAGVPTWLIVLFEEILSLTGANNISEVWPKLRSFLYGGVDFEPYRKIFAEYLPSPDIGFREVYNASEGYFAIQNHKNEDGMLLLMDNEIFYEFITWEDYQSGHYLCRTSQDLDKGETYVMLISNTAGLYRYVIGDLVKVVSTRPLKIKHAGRITAHLNVFGEELSIGNAEKAISRVCAKHNCQIWNYTAGPRFLSSKNKGGHDWLIEFINEPESLRMFEQDLDLYLRQINSDYDAKRFGDLALENLKVISLAPGTFEKWMRSKGKYGGQNKIPRLKNDRSLIEELLSIK